MYPEEKRIYAALLTGALLFAILMVFFILTIIRYQRKRVKAYYELMEEEIGLIEKERGRIAKDLHDDIGAMISAVNFLLDGFVSENEQDVKLIARMKGHIDNTMLNIRQLSYAIMPRILGAEGLQAAVKDFLDILTYSKKIKVQFNCNIPKGALEPEKEVLIFRIIQEIVQNILKHANATAIICELNNNGKLIELHISDNGVGFNHKNTKLKRGGAGLQNIMARVTILKAKIYLTAEQQKGVDYLIKIPL